MSAANLPDCTPLVLRCASNRLIDVRRINQMHEPPPVPYEKHSARRRDGRHAEEDDPEEDDPEEDVPEAAPPAWEPWGDGEAYRPADWEAWSAEGWTRVRRVVRRPVPPGTRFLAVATPTGVLCAAAGQRLARTNVANGPRAVGMRDLVGATLLGADAPRPTKVAVNIYLTHDFGWVAMQYAAAEPPGRPLPPLRADFLNPCREGHLLFSRCIGDGDPAERPEDLPIWVPGYAEAAAMFQAVDSAEHRAALDTSLAPEAFCVRQVLTDGRPPVRDADRVLEVREMPVETAYLWGLETDAPWHQAGAGRLLAASLQ